MKLPFLASATAILFVAGCAAGTSSNVNDAGYLIELPEEVLAIVAPNQNLSSVRVRPEDGCYWYLHTGPVESTLLPLRTVEGRPICTAASA